MRDRTSPRRAATLRPDRRRVETKRHGLRGLALAIGILLAACGADETHDGAARISINDAVVTPTLGAVRTNAGYLLIRNDGTANDQLLGAASSAAGSVEIHASLVQDGVVRMETVKQPITIPANSAVAFQSGGYHLMIFDPARPLSAGESFPLVLRFRRSGDVVVSALVAEVRAGRNSTTRRSSDHAHH